MSYEELVPDAPTEWGRWGPDDEIGRVNLLDDAAVRTAAATCIRSGKRFSLALPLGHPDGDPCLPGRPPAEHRMTSDQDAYLTGGQEPSPGGARFAEDTISLPCHGTTHMDALGHAYTADKLWNGYDASTTVGGLDRAGVGALARRGVVGRAVLVDLPRHEGVDHLPMSRQITVAQIQDALRHQGTELRQADVLILRTGIFRLFYEQGADAYYANFNEPGVTYEPELLDLLAAHDVVGLGTDTLCNEQWHSSTLAADFPLHVLLQRNLGITFHEALWLEDWAADCDQDGSYDAFYVAAPLNIVRGSGAPMNPIVIK